MKRVLVLIVGSIFVSTTASAGAHMGRVTSDALESLNKYMAGKKEPEKNPASGEKTLKIVRLMSSSHREENGEGQKCAEGVVKPNPVVTSYDHVGFDEAGVARLVSSSLEIQDCVGIAGPSNLYVLGDAPAQGEHRKRVDQVHLNETKKFQLERMISNMGALPADCKITLKVDKEWKIVDMQGCEENR